MDRENDEGNIEYKLKISDYKVSESTTQMRYRVNEGNGEARYFIGVSDGGTIVGISKKDYDITYKNLKIMARNNNYAITLLSCKNVENDKNVYEFIVREINPIQYSDAKVTVCGSVDTGKSTLIGVLTTGKYDDGRGKARLSIFNHKHEIDSGRTSSIAQHIMGFDAWGKEITGSWPEIVKKSNKIISFYDLAGHKKYLKTTINGLTTSFPDLAIIMVGANMGITMLTREHLFLCVSLKIPFIILVSKIDICKNRRNVLKETLSKIKKILKFPQVRKVPYIISSEEDVITAATNLKNNSVVPIFKISNVSGLGINKLKTFLSLLPTRNKIHNSNVELLVDTIFNIKGIGTVLGGHLLSGEVKINDVLKIGPINKKGEFENISVKSIHVKKVPVLSATADKYVCLAVKIKQEIKNLLRHGQVIVNKDNNIKGSHEFIADVNIIKTHSTSIKVGYEPVIHTRNIRQTCKILNIDGKKCARKINNDQILRTGDCAKIKFRFKFRPEYIKEGYDLLFCEGRVKAVGKIITVL